jgi:hypothetical protein
LYVILPHVIMSAVVKTNKAAGLAKARKRRPGGGRKPSGSIAGKAETFSTRITPETRAALEREASATGQSISQVAERLLWVGIAERRRRSKARPLRALCFVIEQIALEVGSGRWMDPGQYSDRQAAAVERLLNEWRTDPFLFRAFEIAVAKVLNALRPKGEMKSRYPSELIEQLSGEDFYDPQTTELMKETYKSPENLASHAATNVWIRLNRTDPLSQREREMMRHGEYVGEMMLEEFYGMGDARRDLALDSREQTGGGS